MKRVIVEDIFMEALFSAEIIKKNRIIHSDNFFDSMLNDAHLTDSEKNKVYSQIKESTCDEISELSERRRSIMHELDLYNSEEWEDDDKSQIESKFVSRKRRNIILKTGSILFARIYAIAMTFFMLILIFFTDSPLFYLCIFFAIISCVTVLAFAVCCQKNLADTETERKILDDLERNYKELDEVGTDMVNLEKLRVWACKRLDN